MLVNALKKYKIKELKLKLAFHEDLIRKQSKQINSLSLELSGIKQLQMFNPCGYLVLDSNFIIQENNSQALLLLDKQANSLLGKSFLEYLNERSAAKVTKCLDVFLMEKRSRKYEIEIFSDQNGTKHVEIQFFRCLNQMTHCYLIDLSEKKLQESKLKELENSFHSLDHIFQNTSAVALLDENFNLKILNQPFVMAFSKIFSFKIKTNDNLIHILTNFPELRDKIKLACSQVDRGHRNCILVENKSHNQDAYYCYELNFFLPEKLTDKNEMIFKIEDLSHVRLKDYQDGKQRAEIERVSRSNIMGELTSALAHEINQPLTAIQAYTRSCLKKIRNSEVSILEFPLRQIERQAEHAGEIIHKMKNFREGTLYLEQTNLNYLIRKTIGFLYHDLARLKFNFNLLNNIPSTMVDRVKIMQVILNLGRNSIEALKGAAVENPEITLSTHVERNHIVVNFQDNGPGIPAEIHDKILHSYFTTKAQGTGLGLSICRTLVMVHGGVLSVKKVKQGACFVFTIPIKNE